MSWWQLGLSWFMWILGFSSGYLMSSARWHKKMGRVWAGMSKIMEQNLRTPTTTEMIGIIKKETS